MRRSSTQSVTIPCKEIRLHGSLHLPKTTHPPVVIGLHGLFSDSESPKQIALAERCTDHGIAYLRIDHRGCGQSDGEFFTQTTFANRCKDLIAVAEWVRHQSLFRAQLGLFGSSMGGAVALAMAAQLNAGAVATVAAPIRWFPVDETTAQTAGADQMPNDFWDRRMRFDISPQLPAVHHALIFHGTDDEVVPFDHGREIFEAAQKPKKWIYLDKSDHRISQVGHQTQLMETTLSWFCRYLLP